MLSLMSMLVICLVLIMKVTQTFKDDKAIKTSSWSIKSMWQRSDAWQCCNNARIFSMSATTSVALLSMSTSSSRMHFESKSIFVYNDQDWQALRLIVLLLQSTLTEEHLGQAFCCAIKEIDVILPLIVDVCETCMHSATSMLARSSIGSNLKLGMKEALWIFPIISRSLMHGHSKGVDIRQQVKSTRLYKNQALTWCRLLSLLKRHCWRF
jgi:hypothetical protein